MSFAILRLQKLKSFADVGGSLSHNYRNRETLNADDARKYLNEHELNTNEKCMSAIKDRIPEKRRKDAVLCIEHLITASPDWDGWGTAKEIEFFEQSKKWLEKKYSKKNVVSTTIHRDETTPHLVAYVVPVDEETGRLNAKKYIGGSRHTLSQMQTDFAAEVKELGLERGIEGSKAKHTSIKEYYEKVNTYSKTSVLELVRPNAPEPDFFESKEKYAKRVIDSTIDSIFEQIQKKWDEMAILSSEAISAKKQASETHKTLVALEKKVKPYLDATNGMSPNMLDFFNKNLFVIRDNFKEQIRKKKELDKLKEESAKDSKFDKYLSGFTDIEQRFYLFLECQILNNNENRDIAKEKINELRLRVIDNPYFLKSQLQNNEINHSTPTPEPKNIIKNKKKVEEITIESDGSVTRDPGYDFEP